MSFLNPVMLWSTLAVGIPILLHFWHQKKGELLPWAATQWLTEKDLQPSKGIRLDHIFLLIIRCLLIILLALMLSKPIFKGLDYEEEFKKIHLVQPNTSVAANFRFEIEEALKKGEEVYWIDEKTTPLTDFTKTTPLATLNPLVLQTCINQTNNPKKTPIQLKYEFYLVNNQSLSQIQTVFVP
ncbi:MAG: BatA domain-containing protein [Spirosomataceae bacterium]